ncbi:hypothetical protein ACFV9C_27220 [Kribbella sp. NPDC059898]|uniref:hypothetical protein n=1 Tax=Kribbella sp. NPDC059898 TaxID=3346995 RepID=UPI00364BB95A
MGEVDQTKPLLLGYVRKHFLMTPTALGQVKAELVAFAHREGFTLHAIFVDQIETAPAAFQALMDTAVRLEAAAVVVPSLTHLSEAAATTGMKEHVEHYTNARVLVAGGP